MPDSDQIYPGLRHAIENKFPYPIARSFYQLRSISDWMGEIPQLANVLGATLEHLAILSLVEYLSSDRRDPALNSRILDTLQKRMAHGHWSGILRETLTFLNKEKPAYVPFSRELFDFYFPRQGEQTVGTLQNLGDSLLMTRNRMVHGASGALPSHDEHQDFKRHLVEFLQLVAFLKDYPLVSARGAQVQAGVKTHTCLMHMGFHDAFEQAEAQCDLDLEHTKIAMLNPRANEVLYLHPFYLLRSCPEKGCGQTHLFRLERLEKRRAEYVSTEGHKLLDEDAGAELWEMLQVQVGDKLRLNARYLVLESTDTWQKLPPGHLVDSQYEVVEHLRRGGMSDIYKVRGSGGEELALKLLPFQFLSDRDMVRRFRLEASQAGKLNHPNITRVLAHGEDLVDHYLIMELATGWQQPDGTIALDAGELAKPLNEKIVVDLLKQACEGLDYIHNEGIIHRDIKPGNLLLFDGGVVKLADFGIARAREAIALTMTGLAMGTPDYMSPEQSEGTRDLTPASDIYSMGVVMYELLAGKPPFKRSTPMATMYAHLHDAVPDLATVGSTAPQGLHNIVMKCLDKDPERRFKSAKEMHDALERGTVLAPAAEAPQFTRTAGTQGRISVAWRLIPGASEYEIELVNGGTQLSKTPNVYWDSPRIKAGDYKVRVRAYKAGQAGAWSDAVKVSLPQYIGPSPLPPPPIPVQPQPYVAPNAPGPQTQAFIQPIAAPLPPPPQQSTSQPQIQQPPVQQNTSQTYTSPYTPPYTPPASSQLPYPHQQPANSPGPFMQPYGSQMPPNRSWVLWAVVGAIMLIFLIVVIWVIVALARAQPSSQSPTPGPGPAQGQGSANIASVRVDHDSVTNGLKGMLIHVNLTANNLKGVGCQAAAYFSYKEGGQVNGTDPQYTAPDGQAVAAVSLSPDSDSYNNGDLQIFMPYNALITAPGTYEMSFHVVVLQKDPVNSLAVSEENYFNLTNGGP